MMQVVHASASTALLPSVRKMMISTPGETWARPGPAMCSQQWAMLAAHGKADAHFTNLLGQRGCPPPVDLSIDILNPCKLLSLRISLEISRMP